MTLPQIHDNGTSARRPVHAYPLLLGYAECDHAAATPPFDPVAARGMTAHEVRQRWPRFVGPCPTCGERVTRYASLQHYVTGDW